MVKTETAENVVTKIVVTGKVPVMDAMRGWTIQEAIDKKLHWDRGIRTMGEVLQPFIGKEIVLTAEADPVAVKEREARRDEAQSLLAAATGWAGVLQHLLDAATRFVFDGPGGSFSATKLDDGRFGVCRVGSGDVLEPFPLLDDAVKECRQRAAEVPLVEEMTLTRLTAGATEVPAPVAPPETASTQPAPELPVEATPAVAHVEPEPAAEVPVEAPSP